MSEEKTRAPRTSMEGMIWNGNHVLEQALKPGAAGLPKTLFAECLGIALVSIVEVGFIFSGNVGTGICITKKKDGTGWSAPCAIGMTGVGFGLLAGASVKDVVVFLMDPQTVQGMTSQHGIKLGSQLELTVAIGRAGKGDFDLSRRAVGVPISIAYTKGIFGGINLEGAVVGARDKANEKFYGQACTPDDILVNQTATVPEGKVTLLNEVYEKLDKLAQGADAVPDAKEEEKKAAAKEEAEKAAASAAASDPDVVKVDAAAEAAKEAK